jgi:VanZ family protein
VSAPAAVTTAPPAARRWLARALWTATVLYLVLIFWLSSQPNPLPVLTERFSDKLLHLVEYGALGALLVSAMRASGVAPTLAFLVAAAAASLYGATDELHQAFVPQRSCDVRDWVADTLGGTLGAAAAFVALRWIRTQASIRRVRRRAA